MVSIMNANELSSLLEKASLVIEKQNAEIKALKKFKADTDALDKKLFESIQKANEAWDKTANSILKKAQK
jgi:DNA-binding ferritin-like protein